MKVLGREEINKYNSNPVRCFRIFILYKESEAKLDAKVINALKALIIKEKYFI
jgi:hypothetical protein